MTDPTQILRSGTVYDAVTVQYMQKCSYNIDPINGQLIAIGHQKPVVESMEVLQKEIDEFIHKHGIHKRLKNDFRTVNDGELWKDVYKKLQRKCDIKQQQQNIYRKSVIIFYPESGLRETKKQRTMVLKYLKLSYLKKTNEHEEEKKNIDDEHDFDFLQWNSDHMYISHTSIPI
eukprot:451702_1